jgi:uncharacterized protein YdbL (DUF1318 family)
MLLTPSELDARELEMARTTRAQKAGESAKPYVKRLIEDEDLRESLIEAFDAARHAYQRVANGRGPAALVEDKKVHRDLRTAAESLREAADGIKGRPKRRKGRAGRFLLLIVVTAGLILALSEDARKAVLDALFGPEEEFEYPSTTAPAPEQETTTA